MATVGRLERLATRLSTHLRGMLGYKTVYRIADQSSWALYWVAHYLVKGLHQQQIQARQYHAYQSLRNQIVHFDSRYAYLYNPKSDLHASNHAFLTWFHGDPADDDFSALYATLSERLSELDGIVVSNRTTRSQLMRAGVPEEMLTLIPIGVDTTVFQPPTSTQRAALRQKLGIADDEYCIGSFQKDGNGWDQGLEPKLIKGPDVFLDVIAQVKQQHPSLVILLTGPARGYIKQGLEKMGVRYIHHHLEDYHDVAPFYHALDLYLITSRDEGGPKGFMESWASGIPVVSTQMGMPADHIRHGENGFLADVDDVNHLAKWVLNLAQSPQDAHQMTQQALRDVQALDWMKVAKAYHELYRPFL